MDLRWIHLKIKPNNIGDACCYPFFVCTGPSLQNALAVPVVVTEKVRYNHIADKELAHAMNTAEDLCIVAQQMSMFTVQKLKMLHFTDQSIVLRSTEHNHIPDEEGMSRKRTKHVLCDAARNRSLVPLSQASAWYNNYIVLFNRYMHTYCVHALMTYYNARWLNGDFPPAMRNLHAATTRMNNVVE